MSTSPLVKIDRQMQDATYKPCSKKTGYTTACAVGGVVQVKQHPPKVISQFDWAFSSIWRAEGRSKFSAPQIWPVIALTSIHTPAKLVPVFRHVLGGMLGQYDICLEHVRNIPQR
jgi:hypothetical protein